MFTLPLGTPLKSLAIVVFNEFQFEIIAEDEPDRPIIASTATACHCIVLKRLNKARGKETTNTGSGPEFFGFSHSTIQYLIQCLPGAEKCEKYVRSSFDFTAVTSSESVSERIIEISEITNSYPAISNQSIKDTRDVYTYTHVCEG